MYFQPIIFVANRNSLQEELSTYLNSRNLFPHKEEIVIFSSEKSSIGIKEIAKLNKEIANVNDELKVYIIEESEKLTEEAQNSLLKTLEEPNANSLIILATDNSDSLRETIRSRCQEVYISANTRRSEDAFEKFINSDYIKRKEIIESITKEERAREFALDLNLYIIEYARVSRPEIGDSLMQIYRSLRQGCNLKLGLENLSNLLL